jgi:hypothetical protein
MPEEHRARPRQKGCGLHLWPEEQSADLASRGSLRFRCVHVRTTSVRRK